LQPHQRELKDLEPLIGRSNRVYEILNRKRPLTVEMIRRLHRQLGIPAQVLIAENVAPVKPHAA